MGALLMRVLRVPSAVIVNLVLDAPVMQEFLEDRCTADLMTPAVNALLQDDDLNRESAPGPLADVAGGNPGCSRGGDYSVAIATGLAFGDIDSRAPASRYKAGVGARYAGLVLNHFIPLRHPADGPRKQNRKYGCRKAHGFQGDAGIKSIFG